MRIAYFGLCATAVLIPILMACQTAPQQPQPTNGYPPGYTPQPGYPAAQPVPPAYQAPPPANTPAPPPNTAVTPASPFPFPIPTAIPSGLIPGWPAPTTK